MESKGLNLFKVESELPKKKFKKKRVANIMMSSLPFDQAFKKIEKNKSMGQSYGMTRNQSLN
jgi:hypothetical protein